ASPPRRGHTQQPRVAQRTLGRRAARDCQYPEGVTQRYAPPFVQPLRRRELLILRDPQGALRDPGLLSVTPFGVRLKRWAGFQSADMVLVPLAHERHAPQRSPVVRVDLQAALVRLARRPGVAEQPPRLAEVEPGGDQGRVIVHRLLQRAAGL